MVANRYQPASNNKERPPVGCSYFASSFDDRANITARAAERWSFNRSLADAKSEATSTSAPPCTPRMLVHSAVAMGGGMPTRNTWSERPGFVGWAIRASSADGVISSPKNAAASETATTGVSANITCACAAKAAAGNHPRYNSACCCCGHKRCGAIGRSERQGALQALEITPVLDRSVPPRWVGRDRIAAQLNEVVGCG